MQQVFFRVFFAIVLGGVVLGIAMNMYYDVRARGNIQTLLQELADSARKGDAVSLLQRQFTKTLVLQNEMAPGQLFSMLQDTLRFALLVRQLPNTTPRFSSTWSEQRFAMSGTVSLLDEAGNERFSFTAVMWNRLDNRGKEHWILRSWSEPRRRTEQIIRHLRNSVDRDRLMMELRDRFFHPAGPMPYLKAEKLQKNLLQQLSGIGKLDPLKTYKPEGAQRTLLQLESFWKEGDKPVRARALNFLLGRTTNLKPEEIDTIRQAVDSLHKALLTEEPDISPALSVLADLSKKLGCESVTGGVKARLSKLAGVAFLHAAGAGKRPWPLTLHRARSWLSLPTEKLLAALADFLALKEEWTKRALDVVKDFPKMPETAIKTLPSKRVEWFKNFIGYLSHRLKVESCSALKGYLISQLGAIGRLPDPRTREKLYNLAREAKEGKIDVCDVLTKFASPKVVFETAVLEVERVLKEAGDRRDAIMAYMRKAVAAVEDESKRASLMRRLNELASPEKPFFVEPLVADVAAEGISTYPGGGHLSLLVSGFMNGVLSARGGAVATARSLAAQIRKLSDPQKRREWTLAGHEKPPRVFGLLGWVEAPFIFPEEVRAELVEKAEELIESDTAPLTPLFEALKKALSRDDVKQRIKLITLKKVAKRLPACSQTIRLKSLIEGLMLCTKGGYRKLLRSLRAVDPSRDITRTSFEGMLRRAIAKPQTLKRDQAYTIREYARRVPTTVYRKRKYTLREEDAAVTDVETILKKAEPIRQKVEKLKDAMPLYDEEILKECERLAEELYKPTSETKRRLADFLFKTMQFTGDLDAYLNKYAAESKLLKERLEKSEEKQFEEMVEQKSPEWQDIMKQLIERHVGCRTYVTLKRQLMLMRLAANLALDELLTQVEAFVKSRDCLWMTLVQELASTLRGAVKEHKKDETSKARKKEEAALLREIFSAREEGDLKKYARQKCEKALKLVSHPANIRIHLTESASGFLSGYLLGGRRQGGQERAYYLSNMLERVVWLKDDALFPKVVDEMAADMLSGTAIRNQIVSLAQRYGRSEKGRRDKAEGAVSSTIAKLGSDVAWAVTKLAFNTAKPDDLRAFIDGRKKSVADALLNAFKQKIGASPDGKDKWWEYLELRKSYKLADYRLLCQLRRLRFERFADRRAKIRKLAKQLLSLIRGLEEEDYLKEKDGEPVYEKVMELCYKLRLQCDRTYDESEYIHMDVLVAKRLDEDWNQRWVIVDVAGLERADEVERIGEQEEEKRARLMEWRR